MTQIAISIEQDLKTKLNQRLKNQGITTKGFFLSCIDAYLNNQISIGVISKSSEPFSEDVIVNESMSDVLEYMKKHERTAKTI